MRAVLLASLVAALVPVIPSPASAASPASGAEASNPRKTRIAVLDIKTVGVLDPKLMEGLSSLLASEVSARADLLVLGSADLRAMIGFDRERQLLGCSENSCMAEIGGALGVDYLLTSEGSKIGSTWLLTFALLDVTRARAVKRLSKRTNSEDKLVDAAIQGVHELLQALPTASAEMAGARPMPAGGAATGPVSSSSAPVQDSGRSGAFSWSLVGGGVVAAAGGAWLLVQSWETRDLWDDQQGDGLPLVTRAEADDAVLRSRIGVGLMGVGGAVLTWGLLRLVLPESSESATSASLVPGPGSATLLFTTSIP